MAVDMIIGAAIFLAGSGFGMLVRLPHRRRGSGDPRPVCGCGHHYAMHDPTSGMCHAVTPMATEVGAGKVVMEPRDCACRTYSGPEPLPAFYAPPIHG
jgi:hypothetical protein